MNLRSSSQSNPHDDFVDTSLDAQCGLLENVPDTQIYGSIDGIIRMKQGEATIRNTPPPSAFKASASYRKNYVKAEAMAPMKGDTFRTETREQEIQGEDDDDEDYSPELFSEESLSPGSFQSFSSDDDDFTEELRDLAKDTAECSESGS